MKGERILYGNDTAIAREGIQAIMQEYGSREGHEHQLIGTVSSVKELKAFLSEPDNLRPTIFLFDPRFPFLADGEKAARILQEISPETVIVTLPSYGDMSFKHIPLHQGIDVDVLITLFTNLQHTAK